MELVWLSRRPYKFARPSLPLLFAIRHLLLHLYHLIHLIQPPPPPSIKMGYEKGTFSLSPPPPSTPLPASSCRGPVAPVEFAHHHDGSLWSSEACWVMSRQVRGLLQGLVVQSAALRPAGRAQRLAGHDATRKLLDGLDANTIPQAMLRRVPTSSRPAARSATP
jgi:hypothetical protein